MELCDNVGHSQVPVYSVFLKLKDNQMTTNKTHRNSHASNAVYGLGFIGAVIYYIQMATSFWTGVIGFFKALLWPAFMVYEALRYLEA